MSVEFSHQESRLEGLFSEELHVEPRRRKDDDDDNFARHHVNGHVVPLPLIK